MTGLKEIIEKRTGLKLSDIPRNALKKFGGHEAGKKYYCGYWQKVYEVLEVKQVEDWRGWSVVCKWDDGHINEHCTSLHPGHDFIVIE
jgi:hypothetical protein